MDPIAEYARHGKHLMTNKTDPLCYGGVGENLVLSFDVVTVTTWKEVLVNHFEGIDGLFSSLREYLRWPAQGRDAPPPPLSAQCFSFGRGGSIKQRMEELFTDVVQCFFGMPHGDAARYVLAIEQTYYVLSLDKGTLVYEPAATISALVTLLGTPSEHFRSIVIDRYALSGTALSALFPANRSGVVQLFFMAVGEATDVFILDELGSLFYQRMTFVDRDNVGGHFSAFLDSVHNRQYYEIAGGDEQTNRNVQGVECYEIVPRGVDKPPALVAREIVRRRRPGEIRLQVIGEMRNDEQRLTIYCDDREFSTMEFGQELFAHVAKHILSRRRSGERYPIYITDLDLPHSMFEVNAGNGQVQTIHYLNFKRRIEKQLNEAMQQQPVPVSTV
jgi:adenylate cyclase class 1